MTLPTKYSAPCGVAGCEAAIAQVVKTGEGTAPAIAAAKRFWLEHMKAAHPEVVTDDTTEDGAPVHAEYT